MSSFPALAEAAAHLRPALALVLGSGMGAVPHHFQPELSVPFGEVPGLVETSVAGHSGKLSLGKCAGRPVLVFHGRLHFYEGHSWERVGAPVRLAAQLGVRVLILTSAAGGIRDDLAPGRLMAIRDHLNWQRPGSWRESGPAGCLSLGGERPSTYSERLLRLMQEVERERGRELPTGSYGAVTGPSYETPAEILALRACGADAVGMSTAHEVETAAALGLECAAVSCITNRAAGLSGSPLDHEEVLRTAAQHAERLSELLEGVLGQV